MIAPEIRQPGIDPHARTGPDQQSIRIRNGASRRQQC
jgi:hypothetical protein